MRDFTCIADAAAERLVAVVVTHQRREKLKKALAHLFESTPHALSHVVVVDNASCDGTAEWLATVEDPRLIVLRLEQNLGGAGGFEAGLRYATKTLDPDWFLIMDDDARPLSGTLERFHAVPRDNREAWAAAVFYPSGALCEMNRPTRNPFWHFGSFLGALTNGRRGFHISDVEFAGPETCAVDAASFVGLFVSRRAITRVGYPDRSIFLYGDDVLYTLGLRVAGGRIEFDPTLHFEHDCDSSRPGTKVFDPVWRAYFHHRNLIFVYRRAAGPLFWPVFALFLPKWRRMARDYGEDAPAFRALLKRALRDGLRHDTSVTLAEVQKLAETARKATRSVAKPGRRMPEVAVLRAGAVSRD